MLQSYVDRVDRYGAAGWACDDAHPQAPLHLLVLDNDRLVARVLANRYRADLEAAGIGNGRHGFEVEFPAALPASERHVVRICREADGADLERSPAVIEAPPSSAMARELLAEMLAGELCDDELASLIDCMVEHVERAVQRLADRHGGRVARAEYRLFLDRWRRRAANGAAASHAPPRPRALIVDDRLPEPGRDAGSAAILSHIRSLQRLGFSVSFVAALDFTADGGAALLASLDVACCGAPYYGSVEEVLRRQAGTFELVYLHRVTNAAKYSELARHYCPQAQLIYAVADLHHLRIARQAAVEDRPELAGVANRLRLLELTSATLADAVITHSSAEAEILKAQVGGAKVHTVRWSAASGPTRVPFRQRQGIAFIGGYGHPPNLDAARWLIAEIMPLVRRRAPSIECLLVGDGLPADLLQVAGPGVCATGRVDDLGEIFDRVRATVAPLRYGAGIKGKVVDSFAAGVPCVMTPIAAEGLDLPGPVQGCIAATADETASAILRLHDDANLNRQCRNAGLRYIATAFSEPQLDAAIGRLLAPP